MRIVFARVALLTFLGLSSCSANHNAVHIDYSIPGYSVAGIGAKQRLVVSGRRPEKDDTGKWREGKRIICAEPSPDAMTARAAAFSGSVGNAQQAVGGSFGDSEAAASIGLRTQTIQLLRDAYFRLCEAYLNGALNETGYKVALVYIDELMTTLLAVDAVAGTRTAPAASIVAGAPATNTSATSAPVSDGEDDQKAVSTGAKNASTASTTGNASSTISSAKTSCCGGLNEHGGTVLKKALEITQASSTGVLCVLLLTQGGANGLNSTIKSACEKRIKESIEIKASATPASSKALAALSKKVTDESKATKKLVDSVLKKLADRPDLTKDAAYRKLIEILTKLAEPPRIIVPN